MLGFVPDHPWLFLIVACIAVLIIGIDKSGFAGGIGTIATPLLAVFVSPYVAAGILLPIFCACDLITLWYYRKLNDRRNLKALLPGAFAGITAAALFIAIFKAQKELAEAILSGTIGIISILFVIYQVYQAKLLKKMPPLPIGHKSGPLFGFATGFTSTLAHAGGPPATMYLLPQQLDRAIYVRTMAWLFCTINYTKLIPYIALGMISIDKFKISLMLMPLAPIGVLLGAHINRWVSQRVFVNVIRVALLLTGIHLLIGKALTGMISSLFQ